MLHKLRIALAVTLFALAAIITPVAAGFETSGPSSLPMESISLNFLGGP
jgi:hypothetical protein